MKRITTLLMSAGLLLTVIAVPVAAHEGEEHEDEIMQTTVTSTQETTSEDDKQTTLESRNSKRKAAFEAKLLRGASQLKLKSRCKAAQGLIKGPQARAKSIKTSRTNVYDNLESRLDKLVEKLKLKNVDTSELEAEITALKALVDQFFTDLEAYTIAVDDLVNMDCEADPDAFKAALEDARAQRVTLKEEAAGIRELLKETIKPTLKAIRTQLAGETSGETNQTDNESETESETEGEQ